MFLNSVRLRLSLFFLRQAATKIKGASFLPGFQAKFHQITEQSF
jgi:hypothetical protein